MKSKLKIEEVLANKILMDYIVGIKRGSGRGNLGNLFKYFEEVDFNEIDELSQGGGDLEDFEPYYTHIAKGEYGNCILVLYRYKWLDIIEEKDKNMALGMYSYQFKGVIMTNWFKGKLKEAIELEIKQVEIK